MVAMKHTQSYFVYPSKFCDYFELKKLKITEVYEVIFLRPQVTCPKFFDIGTRNALYTILRSPVSLGDC